MTQDATANPSPDSLIFRDDKALDTPIDRALLRPYLETRFRDDVQGIRALGALLILVFHLWVHKVSGGVDVFFVISGYLMGGVLLRRTAHDGRVMPARFWGGVITRIAPAAYLVMFCTVLFGYLYIPAPLWRATIDDLLFSSLQLENLQLMRNGVNYLDRHNPPGPFQQFWALSVQVQFYLLLPGVIAVGLWLTRRFQSRLPLMLWVGALLLLSFGYGLWVTDHNPSRAYFNTLARFWEFLTGVLLALLLPLLPSIRRGWCQAMGAVGLALLLGTGFLPTEVDFPGYAALAPVLAAALLLCAGHHPGKTVVQRWLTQRHLVQIGSMSFTLYLWHWPVLVFVQHVHGIERFNLPQGLLVICLSLLLATLTSQLVETPWRRRIPNSQYLRAFMLGVICLMPLFALWVGGKFMILQSLRAAEVVAEGERDFFPGNQITLQDDARRLSLGHFMGVKRNISPAAREPCDRGMYSADVIVCAFGDLEADPIVALVGGSHASQWEPAFSEIGRRYGFRLISITMSACSLGYQPWALRSEACKRWNQDLLPVLERLRPAVVITTATRSNPPAGAASQVEFVPEGFVASLERILALGIPVIGIRDNPWFERDPSSCVWQNPARASRCARAKHEVLLEENPAVALEQRLPGFHTLDLSDLLCANNRCPAYFDGRLIWRDKHHLTRSFVHYMATAVQGAVESQTPVLPRGKRISFLEGYGDAGPRP